VVVAVNEGIVSVPVLIKDVDVEVEVIIVSGGSMIPEDEVMICGLD
jgi:hypothetical protein